MKVVIGVKVWLEDESGFSFGPGQMKLLKNIDAFGSLRKAAEHMGMSYRRAWGRIKKMEAPLEKPLVQKQGGNKKGFSLTPFALELVKGYERWVETVTVFAEENAGEALPEGLRPRP